MAEDPRSARPDDVDPVRLAHFRILGRLGRGGMGIVYRAEDEKLQRVVALKVLPPAFEADRDRRARFLREARAAAAVSHPNIASVHEIGESDGRVFIAMELVEGRTLRAMLASGPIAVADAVRIATQIARGLAKAHQAHIVHRDLKPDNVIVGEDLHTKILDFGLAKVTSSEPAETPSALERQETATREGMLVGTPQYMSPEQAKGRTLDPTSDIFSFGIVLYEMVTGRRPFEGPSITEIIIAIDRDAPRPVSDANPLVPAPLVRVIDRCLEKDPARRYPDGRALADDLASLRLDASSSAPVSHVAPAPAASAVVTAPALSPVGPFMPPSFVAPPPAHLPVREKRTRRWWALIAVLAVFAGMRTLKCAGGAGGTGGGGGGTRGKVVTALPPQAAQALSALAAAGAALQGGVKLACPPLLASGVEGPSGWLGAAAANVTCRRAAILMGGALDHVVVPAELLDLPRQPTDDFPRDPYGAPGARDRAITAAKARAAAWLDGTVERKGDGFHVELVIREPDGDEVEHGEGSGHHVYLAVADAMRRSWVKEDAIEKADAIDPEIARWSGVKDVDLALEVEDWHDSLGSSPVSTQAALAKLKERKAELGPLWPHIQSESQMPMLVENDAYDPVTLDRSSPAAFAISAVSYAETVSDANRTALAAEAAKLRDVEPSHQGRHALLMAQAEILVSGGQMLQALELALGELREEPRNDHTWEIPLLTLQGQPSPGPVVRAFAAWMPEDHASWAAIATSDVGLKDTASRLSFARRAYDLSPDFPMFGDTLGKLLVQAGRPEEARSIATSMLTVGSFMDPAAQGILVLVDATEAHFGAAIGRGAAALDRVDRFGVQVGDWYLIDALTGAGAVAQSTSMAIGTTSRSASSWSTHPGWAMASTSAARSSSPPPMRASWRHATSPSAASHGCGSCSPPATSPRRSRRPARTSTAAIATRRAISAAQPAPGVPSSRDTRPTRDLRATPSRASAPWRSTRPASTSWLRSSTRRA
jgi:eukaryotic-like serine/threonine-protein kinase